MVGPTTARGAPARTRLPDRPDVFVSYSRRDRVFVLERLLPALLERDKDVWIDAEDIPPAADWRETVLDGIAKSSAFVFVLSPDSLASEVCREELARALEVNKRLVPVLCRDVAAAEVPEELQRPNWVLLREGDDPDAGLARLVEALDTDLEWRELHTRIAVRAEEWSREGRDRSFLLRGSDLKGAEAWLAQQGSHREGATPQQAEYVVRSREAANRRQRATLAAVAAALAVAVTLAVVAWTQRQQAVEQASVASSRELAATSLSLLGRDPELSVLLAREASRRKPTEQAEEALRRSLLRWPERRAFDLGEPVETAAYSPDGHEVLTAAGDEARLHDAASGRLIRRLPAPGGKVAVARFSPGGRAVVVAAGDGAVVADARSGRIVSRVSGSGAPVTSARFSADGRRALAATVDRVQVFEVGTGRKVATLDDPSMIAGALLSSTGDRVVTYGVSRTARVWSVSTGRPGAVLRHDGPITDATISPDGRLLVTATLGGVATVWSLPAGRRVATLAHLTPVNGASFSRDGRLLFTESSYGRVWNTRTRRTVRELRQDARVVSSAISRDGRLVVTGDVNGDGRVFDVASGRVVNRLSGHQGEIGAAAFSPDGRHVLTSGKDATVRIWEAAPGSSALELRRDDETVREAVVSPDRRMVATASDRGVARVWNAATGELEATLRGPGGPLTSLAWDDEGRLLAAGAESGQARIWSVSDGRSLATLRGHTGPVMAIDLSRDGHTAATGGEDATVRIWEARTGRPRARIGPVGEVGVTSVSFALRGRRLVADFGEGIGLAESPSGRELTAFASEFGGAVSPDGRTVAVGGLGGGLGDVRLRRASDGRQVATLAAPEGAYELAFGPNGRSLAAVGPSGFGYVWNLPSGRRTLRVREPSVFTLAIGPDQRFAAAGHEDGLVRVFELGSEELVATLGERGRRRVRDVAFGPKGRSVVATEQRGGTWILPCDVCRSQPELVRLADQRLPRSLTPAERRRFLHEAEQ